MTLLDVLLAIRLTDLRTLLQDAIVSTQTHRATHIGHVLLICHQVNHLMRGVRLHLRGIGIRHTQHVTSELNHHALHSQADTQARHIVLTGILQGCELALNTTLTEARSDQNTIHILQLLSYVLVIQLLGMEQVQIQLTMIVNSGLQQRLVDRLIGILQLHVLANQTDLNRLRSTALQGKELPPSLQLRCRTNLHAYFTQDNLIHLLTLQYQRHLIDGRHVNGLDHRILGHITEKRYLTQQVLVQLMLRTQHQNIRLDT